MQQLTIQIVTANFNWSGNPHDASATRIVLKNHSLHDTTICFKNKAINTHLLHEKLLIIRKTQNTSKTSDSPGQNIWNKVKKSSKTGQNKKSLMFTFAFFLTAISKV